MKKSECKRHNCHWFDGFACHRVTDNYTGIEVENVTQGCVPETYNEYVKRCRKVVSMTKVSCKDCRHRLKCTPEEFAGLKRSFYYCEIYPFGRRGASLKLHQSLQLCRFNKWEPKKK